MKTLNFHGNFFKKIIFVKSRFLVTAPNRFRDIYAHQPSEWYSPFSMNLESVNFSSGKKFDMYVYIHIGWGIYLRSIVSYEVGWFTLSGAII